MKAISLNIADYKPINGVYVCSQCNKVTDVACHSHTVKDIEMFGLAIQSYTSHTYMSDCCGAESFVDYENYPPSRAGGFSGYAI